MKIEMDLLISFAWATLFVWLGFGIFNFIKMIYVCETINNKERFILAMKCLGYLLFSGFIFNLRDEHSFMTDDENADYGDIDEDLNDETKEEFAKYKYGLAVYDPNSQKGEQVDVTHMVFYKKPPTASDRIALIKELKENEMFGLTTDINKMEIFEMSKEAVEQVMKERGIIV